MTLQMKLDPQYVLYEMDYFERVALLKYQHYSNKDNWETARYIAWMIANVNCKNQIKLTDLMKFPWEREDEKEQVSDETKLRLQNKSKEFLNFLNS